MSKYELVWILAGDAASGAIDGSIDTVKGLITGAGGQVEDAYLWDQRTMAYEIDKHGEGNYCVSRFTVGGDKIQEISDSLRIEDGILRYMISKVGK